MTGPPTKPDAEPMELQTHLFRTLRLAVEPFTRPELDRALREWWLTYLYPGPPTKWERITSRDDGDWAALWAEIHDLRAEVRELRQQKFPEADDGKRPFRGEAVAKPAEKPTGLRSFTGSAS